MDKSLEEILSMSDSALELLFKANPAHEHEPRYKALIAFFPEVDKALKEKGGQFVRFMQLKFIILLVNFMLMIYKYIFHSLQMRFMLTTIVIS